MLAGLYQPKHSDFPKHLANSYYRVVVDELKWVEEAIQLDHEGRWVVQTEIYVKGQIASLKNALLEPVGEAVVVSMSGGAAEIQRKQAVIRAYERELDTLHKTYAKVVEGIARNNRKPRGPLQQAYEATRERNTFWFLTDYLRHECAKRGGCCGRACKCCDKPRESTRELFRYGHCAGCCACCIELRGVPRGMRKMFRKRTGLSFERVVRKHHWAETGQYIWGADFTQPVSWAERFIETLAENEC